MPPRLMDLPGWQACALIYTPYGAGIGVSNLEHLSLACAHVCGRHINAGTNKTFFCEFYGEPPRDLFQFITGVVLGINTSISPPTPANGTSTTAHVDVTREAKTCTYFTFTSLLSRERAVLPVLGPRAPDEHPGTVVRDGEAQAQQVVAGLDQSQDATHPVPLLLLTLPVLDVCHQLVLQDAGLVAEEPFHYLEEVGAFLPARRRHAVP